MYSLSDRGQEYVARLNSLREEYVGWFDGIATAMGEIFGVNREDVENEDMNWYLVGLLSPLAKEVVRAKKAGVPDEDLGDIISGAAEDVRLAAKKAGRKSRRNKKNRRNKK